MAKRFLIIQTAFIGDVVLATAIIEKLRHYYPAAQIDFLLRQGNESLLENNPHIHRILSWNKKQNKIRNLIRLSFEVRRQQYDCIINLHRFASSGLVCFISGAKEKFGYTQNPFSFIYTKKIKHEIGNGVHEVVRNQKLIETLTDHAAAQTRLYPAVSDFEKVKQLTAQCPKYICIAPASVWFTKQLPMLKWIELIEQTPEDGIHIFLLGGKEDEPLCADIISKVSKTSITNLSGKLTFLQSAALMKDAEINFVNDSAPLHIGSAVNANIVAFFCSTIPDFGFGPLSKNSRILQTAEKLTCRPCGLHGHRQCPEGHFKCAHTIKINFPSYL